MNQYNLNAQYMSGTILDTGNTEVSIFIIYSSRASFHDVVIVSYSVSQYQLAKYLKSSIKLYF